MDEFSFPRVIFSPSYQRADGNCGCSGANPWKSRRLSPLVKDRDGGRRGGERARKRAREIRNFRSDSKLRPPPANISATRICELSRLLDERPPFSSYKYNYVCCLRVK